MSLEYFASSPEEARVSFRDCLSDLQAGWPRAELAGWPLPNQSEHEVDFIQAPAMAAKERMLIITTGLHGVEGMIGNAILRLFVREVAAKLDPGKTGLLLIHPINPWGMAKQRRTNEDNVDLNRNFLSGENGFDPPANTDYQRLRFLLEPAGPVGPIWMERLWFWSRLARGLIRLGPDRLLAATLEGQYRQPQGLYFGGEGPTAESEWLRQIVAAQSNGYQQVCWIDIHSGYGPRDRMTIVDSPLEAAEPYDQQDRFDYAPVIQAEAATFYEINGDMVDAAYRWFSEGDNAPSRFYATAFEFGTFGDSIGASIRSLRALILENQLWFHGAGSERAREWVLGEFRSLFYPEDSAWRRKALADARQAFDGILRAEGFVIEERRVDR